jgi:hypothetical protein
MSAALQAAQAYVARGWNPLPLPFKAKKPTDDGWQNRVIGAADLPRYFNGNPQNVGVVLGPTSNGLTDVDLDCPEAIALAPYVLPRTGAIFGRQSAPASHWLYRSALASTSEDEKARISFKDPLRPAREAMVLEVRVGGYKGAQTVFPGSVHETDEEIRWDENGEPTEDSDNDLLKRAHLLASSCLLARYWPGEGARHDAALSVGGFLARAGLKVPTIKYLVEAIARTAGDSEHQDRKATAEDAAQAFHAGKRARGYPELKKAFGEEAARQVAHWLTYHGSTDNTAESVESADTAGLEIARLAKLPLIEYERERKAAAELLGFRASMLDRLVQGERDRLGLDDDDDAGMQGRAIVFAEPAPWPEAVDGAALLDEISKAIGAHVIMPETSRDACALWAAHTYLLDCTMISPRLAITSPTRGCGKTTALDVISQLVLRPLPAANVSASAIFRVVEGFRPTLMIDEADSFLRDNEELRGVLNSGHRKGGAVLRNVGDDHEPRSFSTYGACAIALIGQLPGTLTDRSVPIMLTRRKRDEAITPFRLDRVEHLVVLARKLGRWTTDNAVAIAATEPEIPSGIYNRAADNWRPLLALAEVAGGNWLDRGQRAALASVADIDDTSRLELVLGDIRSIFTGKGIERISSTLLTELLADMEGRPWAEYGRSEKPITPAKLARLLKPVAVVSQTIRFTSDDTRKGYYRHQFEEAFQRFLSPDDGPLPTEGAFKTSQRHNADEMGTSDLFQNETEEVDVTDRKREKPNNDGLCDVVTLSKGGSGDSGEDRTCAQCRGEINGKEQLVSVSGRSVWLHPECERFWLAALDEGHKEQAKPRPADNGCTGGALVAKGEFGEAKARHPLVTFFGIEPFDPCVQCGNTDGVVQHVRFNRHPGRPSLNLHEACVASWLACHEESES